MFDPKRMEWIGKLVFVVVYFGLVAAGYLVFMR